MQINIIVLILFPKFSTLQSANIHVQHDFFRLTILPSGVEQLQTSEYF